ncbi:MAG: hypothetical protein ACXQTW_08575 [Candidatus Methanospirareceae archaeon]
MRHENNTKKREFERADELMKERIRKLYRERHALELCLMRVGECIAEPEAFLNACRLSNAYPETTKIKRVFYETMMELLEAKEFYKEQLNKITEEIKKLEGEESNGKR